MEEEREIQLIEEQGKGEITVELDEGEVLVIMRALSSQKWSREHSRENNFHSRCIVQVKVYSLIIDSDSCYNVVSISLIEKLKLQTSIHLDICNIQWLNQGKGL